MSFLSDVLGGNFSNLGNDLAPSNFFSDAGTDATQALSNPLFDIGAVASIALPFIAPEIGGLLGIGGAADTAAGTGLGSALGSADLGAAAGATTPLSLAADTGVDSSLSAFLTDPAAAAGGGLPSSALSLSDTVPASTAAASTTPSWFSPDLTTALSSGGATASPASTATDTAFTFGTSPLTSAVDPATATSGTIFGSIPTSGATAVTPSLTSTISNALSPISSVLKTASPIIGLGGLGYNLYEGYEQKQQLNQLTQQEQANAANAASISAADQSAAAPLLSSGQTLTQYLTTNTLPPQFQSEVNQQVASAKAAITQGYASRGQNTNPEENSALAQDLANVDTQAETLKGNLESTLSTAGQQMMQTANQLLQSGLSATELASELPIQVAQLNSSLNAEMSSAVSNFAAALNGTSSKNTISLTLPNNIIGSTGNLNLG